MERLSTECDIVSREIASLGGWFETEKNENNMKSFNHQLLKNVLFYIDICYAEVHVIFIYLPKLTTV